MDHLSKSNIKLVLKGNTKDFSGEMEKKVFINLLPKLMICDINSGLLFYSRAFKDPALYTSWLEPVHAFNVWKTQSL